MHKLISRYKNIKETCKMVDCTFVFGLPFVLRRPVQMRQKIRGPNVKYYWTLVLVTDSRWRRPLIVSIRFPSHLFPNLTTLRYLYLLV